MTDADVCWQGVEVAVTRDPADPDSYRVMFERGGAGHTAPRVRLAIVYVEGGGEPAVSRCSRTKAGEEAGLVRADCERKALAVVQSLAEAMAWDD